MKASIRATLWMGFALCVAQVVSGASFAVTSLTFRGGGVYQSATADVVIDAQGTKAKIAYPLNAEGPLPVVVLGHGFAGKPENQIGWGEHFATYGIIAIAPELCQGMLCAPSVKTVVPIIKATLAYVSGKRAPAAILGKADMKRVAFEGYSSGGQAMLFAAANLQPQAVILLDPVTGTNPFDTDTSRSQADLAQVCSPVLTLYAEPGASLISCNKKSLWKTFGNKSGGPGASAVVKGASHCDIENIAGGMCSSPVIGCGRIASAKLQKVFAHYATAWLLSVLNNDNDAQQALAQAVMGIDGSLRAFETHPVNSAACGMPEHVWAQQWGHPAP